jgi:hypothetical protein
MKLKILTLSVMLVLSPLASANYDSAAALRDAVIASLESKGIETSSTTIDVTTVQFVQAAIDQGVITVEEAIVKYNLNTTVAFTLRLNNKTKTDAKKAVEQGVDSGNGGGSDFPK